jgi:hypothetical protein
MELLLHELPLACHRRVDAMKSRVEYVIFKLYRTPEYWDGPYKVLARAKDEFEKHYANPPRKPQDFGIFKITTTRIQWPRKRKS